MRDRQRRCKYRQTHVYVYVCVRSGAVQRVMSWARAAMASPALKAAADTVPLPAAVGGCASGQPPPPPASPASPSSASRSSAPAASSVALPWPLPGGAPAMLERMLAEDAVAVPLAVAVAVAGGAEEAEDRPKLLKKPSSEEPAEEGLEP